MIFGVKRIYWSLCDLKLRMVNEMMHQFMELNDGTQIVHTDALFDEQKVKLLAKNLFKKLRGNRKDLLVVDWYKDEQSKAKVKSAIGVSLSENLPGSYDTDLFHLKINLLMNHFIYIAVQGYGWVAA